MTTIVSNSVSILASDEKLFTYLANFNNFQHLMPPQVSKWQSTGDTCSFNIQGMADISLKITEKLPYHTLIVTAAGGTPVSLNLTWKFEAIDPENTNTRLILDADLNPMMAMMAKAPLNNFVNMLVDKLKELAESGNI
ncbi:MAG: hypothetical protein NTU44_08530 [Bacteroidetes bacterium]|nr:hypothetical protein [Bacteroidota bacterium]